MAEDRMYMTCSPHPREHGKIIAVVSMGQPQLGDKNVTVLTLTVVDTQAEANAWYGRMQKERPWEARN